MALLITASSPSCSRGEAAGGLQESRAIGHVRCVGRGAAARGADLLGRQGNARRVDVDEAHGGAMLREPHSDCTPEAAAGAGDQDRLLGKLRYRQHE